MPPHFPPDTCDELAAYQLARPSPPAFWAPLGAALFAVFAFLTVGTTAAWYALIDEPRLAKGRSFWVNTVTNFGLLFACASVGLRWAMFDYSTNSTRMPCWVDVCGILVGVGITALMACLRMYMLYTWTLYASLVGQMGDKTTNDDTASVSTGDATASRFENATLSFRFFLQSLAPAAMTRKDSSSNQQHRKSTSDNDRLMQRIHETSLALTPRALLMLAGIFLVPQGVLLVGIFVGTPVYRSGCTGCEWDATLAIACIVQAVLPTLFIANLWRYALYSPPDAYGIKHELMLWTLIVPGSYLLFLLLILSDPNDVMYNYQVSFDLINHISTAEHFLFWSIIPITMAYRDRQQRRKLIGNRVDHASMASVLKAIMDVIAEPEFELLCEKMYVRELQIFVLQVNNFHKTFYDKSEKWRRARVDTIVSTFIAESAPMQVNLGHLLRRDVEQAAKAFDPVRDQDLFDGARREALLLLVDVYKRYVVAKRATGMPGVSTAVSSSAAEML